VASGHPSRRKSLLQGADVTSVCQSSLAQCKQRELTLPSPPAAPPPAASSSCGGWGRSYALIGVHGDVGHLVQRVPVVRDVTPLHAQSFGSVSGLATWITQEGRPGRIKRKKEERKERKKISFRINS